MTWQVIAMVIPIDLRESANAIADVFDPDVGGVHTFNVGCSATGAAPATHLVATTPLRQDHLPLLSDGYALWSALGALAQARGREVRFTEDDCVTLVTRGLFETGRVEDLLSRLGLKILT